MIKIFYKKYFLPTDEYFINNFLVPRLASSDVLSFTLSLMTGFKTDEKKSRNNNSNNEGRKSYILIFFMFLSLLTILFIILLIVKVEFIRELAFTYAFFQTILYVGSVVIGFLKFFSFTLKLRNTYGLDVPLINLKLKKGYLKFDRYINKNVSSYKMIKEKNKEDKLSFYFELYKKGGITKEEYENEKKKILNNS